MIYTHPHLDLDNASSTALLMYHMFGKVVSDQLKFVSSDWSGQLAEGDFAVDIQGEFKGRKITSSNEGVKTLSSFSLVLKFLAPAYNDIFDALAECIDNVDSNPPGFYTDKMMLPNVFNYLKAFYKDDIALLQAWYPIVIGMIESRKELLLAKKQKKRIRYEIINSGKVLAAVIKGPYSLQLPGLSFHDPRVLFFVYEFDNNMGVIRSPKYPHINMGNKLKQYLPDWFHHPSGFLSCWGGYKCPKDSPPNTSLERLIEYLTIVEVK